MTRSSLRALPAYQVARLHERNHEPRYTPAMLRGEMKFSSDEIDAYLLGRIEQRKAGAA